MIRHQIRALRKILQKPVALHSTSVSSKNGQSAEERQSAFIQQLSKEFEDSKHMILRLKKDSALNINFDAWKSRISIMNSYGFSNVNCFELISNFPPLLEIPLVEFENTLMQWHQAILNTKYFQILLMSQPALLEVEGDVIGNRIPQLQLYFNSPKSLVCVLTSCPNLMFDRWGAVVEKINYLLKDKNFNITDLLEGNVLSNSLDFIKFRLDLLEKCGIYKQNKIPIQKQNKYDKSGHINPPLKDMLLENTKDFVKLAKISEEEYFVYEDLFLAGDEDDDETDTDEE